MKLLHLGDLHIDAGFSKANLHIANMAGDIKAQMLKHISEFCVREGIDMIVLAGDIYDNTNANVSRNIIYQFNRWIFDMLQRGIFVVYVNGNHDHWLNESYMGELPSYDNFIYICEDKYLNKHVRIGNTNVVIHAYGYSEQNPFRSVIQEFEPKEHGDDALHIGVLHAVVQGYYTSEEPYYPSTKMQIQNLNYDYFALGHVHRPLDISDRCKYSGGFFPRYYGDYASYGGVFVELDKHYIKTQRVEFSNYKFVQIKIEAGHGALSTLGVLEPANTYISTFDELCDFVESKLNQELTSRQIKRTSSFFDILVEGDIGFVWQYNDEQRLLEQIFGNESKRHRIVMNAKFMRNQTSISHNMELVNLLDKSCDEVFGLLNNLSNESKQNQIDTTFMSVNEQFTYHSQNRDVLKNLVLQYLDGNYAN